MGQYWTNRTNKRRLSHMPRRVRERDLSTIEARRKLAARAKPYYRAIGDKLQLGFRKNHDAPSKWVIRRYLGRGDYKVENIATAEDAKLKADGADVLTFDQ